MYSDEDLYDTDGDYDNDDHLYDDDEVYDNNNSINEPEFDDDVKTEPPKNYNILAEDDIRQRLADDVASVSALLSVPRSSAAILLQCHRWIKADVHSAWFSDEIQTRKSLGLVQYKPHSVKKFKCGICFEKCRKGAHAGCGHMFCCTCWNSYISVSIEDGPKCLSLRCPNPSCTAAVDQDLVDQLCADIDKERYATFLLRSYIENSLEIKWCPAPGCQMAVEYNGNGIGGDGIDVLCKCSHGFCWNCTQEAHSPLGCDTVAKWITKNASEAENVNWILAYTKPCPKCNRAIEKRDGCMHMTCVAPCKFQFCWVCLGPWSEHQDNACNRYTQYGGVTETRREMVRESLMRYTHYYERWFTNEHSRLKASKNLYNFEAVDLETVLLISKKPATEFKFVTKAWLQIVECRRVLKWSYVYGYYIPEQEKAKRTLFECLQGEAELWLERLHQCAEMDLKGLIERLLEGGPKEELLTFRKRLEKLTTSTQTFFKNLVEALENDLSEVNSYCNMKKLKRSRRGHMTKKGIRSNNSKASHSKPKLPV